MSQALALLVCLCAAVSTAAADTSCNPSVATGASCPVTTRELEGDSPSLLQHTGQQAVLSAAASKNLPTEIKELYVLVNGVQYSRKGAEGAFLGRIGSLPLLGLPPTVNFQQMPPDAWLANNVLHPTTVNISSTQEHSFDLSMAVSVHGVNASGDINITGNHSAAYTLQKLTFADEWSILDWLSQPANSAWVQRFKALNYPRIVTAVWMLVSQNAPEIGNSCVGGALSISYLGLGGSISAQGCGHSIWSFSANTVIAYRMSKVQWKDDIALKFEADIGTR